MKKRTITKSELKSLIKEALLKEQSFTREDSNVRVEDAVEGLEMVIFDLKKGLSKLQDRELKGYLENALSHAKQASNLVEKFIRLRSSKSDIFNRQTMDSENYLRSQREFDRAIMDYGIDPDETTAEALYQTLVDDGLVDQDDSTSVGAAESAVAEFMGEY